MPAPELFPIVMFPASIASLAPRMDIVLAYAGLGPAQQLLPHFLALLAVAGAAVVAVVQWSLRSVAPSHAIPKRRQAGVTEIVQRGGPDGVAK